VLPVGANKRVHSCEASNRGDHRKAVLDDLEALIPVGVEVLRIVNVVGLDEPVRLQKSVLRVYVVGCPRIGIYPCHSSTMKDNCL
jgi:hypothetical protein